jgi:hypothetical protein
MWLAEQEKIMQCQSDAGGKQQDEEAMRRQENQVRDEAFIQVLRRDLSRMGEAGIVEQGRGIGLFSYPVSASGKPACQPCHSKQGSCLDAETLSGFSLQPDDLGEDWRLSLSRTIQVNLRPFRFMTH